MPIVNSLLDVFFRTLDVIDVARERVDRALGRSPQPEPWTSEWSPVPPAASAQGTKSSTSEVPPAANDGVAAPRQTQPKEGAPRSKSKGAKPADMAAPSPSDAPQAKKQPTKSGKSGGKGSGAKDSSGGTDGGGTDSGGKDRRAKKGGAGRKGSVDRSGKDFDSPRAKAIVDKLTSEGGGVISESASYEGKKVLARVLWALGAADHTGSELGLTAADASALLHLAAGLEVFATNVARTCRDESLLIVESTPDGRSKRYKLTDAGREAAAGLEVRPISL